MSKEIVMINCSKKTNYLFSITLAVFLAFYFTPYCAYNMPNIIPGVLFIMLILEYAFSQNLRGTDSILTVPTYFAWYILFVLLIFSYKLLGISTCSWNNVIMSAFNYSIIIIGCGMANKIENKNGRLLFLVLSVVYIFNLVDNIRLLLLYPTASVDLNFSWGTKYYSMNIGGSSFVAFVSMMALAFLIITVANKRLKLISIAVFILSIIYMILAGRAISLMTVILGGICIVISSKISTRSSKEKAVVYCLIVFIGLSIFLVLPQLLDAVAGKISSARLSDRLYELSSILKYGSLNQDTSGSQRISLYSLSVRTLFKNPKNFLFGVGLHPANVSELKNWGIGAHSAILDFGAEYGLVGIVIMVNLLRAAYLKTISVITDKKVQSMSKILFSALLVNSVLNNTFTVPCFAAVFIFLPLFIGFVGGYENDII